MTLSNTYIDGTYHIKTGGSWHREDGSFKANQVIRMLERHPEISAGSVCDIGCGAGVVLSELSQKLKGGDRFTGYEVSPQAHSLSLQLQNSRCEFLLKNPFCGSETFDLALCLDVLEHVEDCFSLLRQCGSKATWKMYHIPLDSSASMVLRGANCWDSVGHLHIFTIETALKSIEYCGQRVVDWMLTPTALERPHRAATRLTNLARRVLPEAFAARLIGGYSIMILAR